MTIERPCGGAQSSGFAQLRRCKCLLLPLVLCSAMLLLLLTLHSIPLRSIAQVVRYPRVFIHDPVQSIGPRLAYLSAYKPGHLKHQLVSLLSRSDDEFAQVVCRRLPDEYALFKASRSLLPAPLAPVACASAH